MQGVEARASLVTLVARQSRARLVVDLVVVLQRFRSARTAAGVAPSAPPREVQSDRSELAMVMLLLKHARHLRRDWVAVGGPLMFSHAEATAPQGVWELAAAVVAALEWLKRLALVALAATA